MVDFFLSLHSLGSHDIVDRGLVYELMHHNTAYFVIVPLFILTVVLTFGFIKFCNNFQTFLICIVAKSILQKILIVIESLYRVFFRVWILFKELND